MGEGGGEGREAVMDGPQGRAGVSLRRIGGEDGWPGQEGDMLQEMEEKEQRQKTREIKVTGVQDR